MKLRKIQLRDALTVFNGGAETFLTTEKGYDLAFDAGLVTVSKGEWKRVVPLANVAWFEPGEAAPLAKAKAEKPA